MQREVHRMAKKTAGKGKSSFKLTYATMFEPPDELHSRFDDALAMIKSTMNKEHRMIIGGREVKADETFEDRSPVNQDWILGRFQKSGAGEAQQALAAARKAFPAWSRTPWRDRIRLMRKAADLIDKRVYEIGAVMALEVGKNRMESLGDAAEMADLIRYACDQMEAHKGYVVPMGKDPLKGYRSQNTSVLRPYGVWLVISPFNFPAAL